VSFGTGGEPVRVSGRGLSWWQLRYAHLVAIRSRLLERGLAPASVNLHLVALRRVRTECWRLGHLSGRTTSARPPSPGWPVAGCRPAGRWPIASSPPSISPMAALHTELVTGSWHPSCYRPSDPVAHTDHPRGKACNAPPGAYGTLPPAAQKAAGDALAASLQASAARTGVHYLIWYGRIWNADRAHDGWRPYQGAGVYNTTPTTPDGITGGHYDHVISVY